MTALIWLVIIAVWVAAGITLTRFYRHPPQWWIRREERKRAELAAARRAAETAEYQAALAALSQSFNDLGHALTVTFTPVMADAANAITALAESLRMPDQKEK